MEGSYVVVVSLSVEDFFFFYSLHIFLSAKYFNISIHLVMSLL